jgi:hypothetical protein
MTRKLLSFTTATGLLYVYLLSQLRSGDALFLVASDNIIVNLALLSLAVLAVKLSFSDKFESGVSYAAAAAGSAIAAVMAIAGLIYISVDNIFSGIFLPFDYVIILLLAVNYGLMCLTYSHPPVKFKMPSYKYTIPAMRIRQQLSGYLNRTVVIPGRRTSGSHSL